MIKKDWSFLYYKSFLLHLSPTEVYLLYWIMQLFCFIFWFLLMLESFLNYDEDMSLNSITVNSMKDIIGEQSSSTGLGSFHFLHANVQWEKHIVWWLESFNHVWQSILGIGQIIQPCKKSLTTANTAISLSVAIVQGILQELKKQKNFIFFNWSQANVQKWVWW